MVENEDIFFHFSTNTLNNDNRGKFYIQTNEDYVEKFIWSHWIRYNFGLSSDFKLKEIHIYNKLPKKNLEEEFKKLELNKINKHLF